MGWDMGGKFQREKTYVYLWLIHIDILQKPSQYCKAIILQFKTKQISADVSTEMNRQNLQGRAQVRIILKTPCVGFPCG